MEKPSLIVLSGRRRGRPSLSSSDEPSAAVHLKLAPEDYDHVFQEARRRRKSVQDVIRGAIKRLMIDDKGGTIGNSET